MHAQTRYVFVLTTLLMLIVSGCVRRPPPVPPLPPARMQFFIAVRVSDHEQGVDIVALREALEQPGPQASSQVVQWMPIGEVRWFSSGAGKELEAMETDPISHFAGRDLVATKKDDVYYLLVYTGPTSALVQSSKSNWKVEAASFTQDQLGSPALGFTLDPEGAKLLYELTAGHVGEPLAIVINGRVYSAPTILSGVGARRMIAGNFTADEVFNLKRMLMGQPPLPTAGQN